jgi:hypothetical protein
MFDAPQYVPSISPENVRRLTRQSLGLVLGQLLQFDQLLQDLQPIPCGPRRQRFGYFGCPRSAMHAGCNTFRNDALPYFQAAKCHCGVIHPDPTIQKGCYREQFGW